jgi:ribonuclease HI
LWKELDTLLSKHKYKALWVRGHNGHPENEWCDVRAGEETAKQKLIGE